jgi:hypothetical protein
MERCYCTLFAHGRGTYLFTVKVDLNCLRRYIICTVQPGSSRASDLESGPGPAVLFVMQVSLFLRN